MAELSALYASALFRLIIEDRVGDDGGVKIIDGEKYVDDVYRQTLFIRDVFKDAKIRRALTHPHIANAEKKALFSGAFKQRIHADLFALLLLVIDKNRETFFLPAIQTLIGMIKKYQRKTTANVVVAAALSAEQATALREILSRKLDKQVDVRVKVDPSVIGGPFINVDGYYIDRTIKRRLCDLTAEMKEGCGA